MPAKDFRGLINQDRVEGRMRTRLRDTLSALKSKPSKGVNGLRG